MLSTIKTTAAAAAPHIGQALVAGGRGAAAIAVAIKAKQYGTVQAFSLVEHLEDAGRAAKEAKKAASTTTSTKAQERKAS